MKEATSPFERLIVSAFKEEMMRSMAAHPEYIEEALQLCVKDNQPYSWRSAWLLWSCIEENDLRVQPHIKKLIAVVGDKESGHQRELIKVLAMMELDDDDEGKLFDICVKAWEKISNTPSVRFIAFQYILKIAKKYPELSKEIELFTQDHYLNSLSPGVKNSINKRIKKLSIGK